jgi:hypothetical protein
MATAEKVARGYLGTLLRLTLLAPDLVEAILNWRQPEGVTLPRLLEGVPVGLGEAEIGLSRGCARCDDVFRHLMRRRRLIPTEELAPCGQHATCRFFIWSSLTRRLGSR